MKERTTEPTPEVRQAVRELCEGWQDSMAFRHLHALMQGNLLESALRLGGTGPAPTPTLLRIDAADIRCVADGLAQFLEHLADRMEVQSN